MTCVNPSSRDFFEEKYTRDADPWKFASSAYEQDRYREILSALAGKSYHSALEPGCSIGILTESLASISDEVYAFDISPTAVAYARMRCSHLPNVHIDCGELSLDLKCQGVDLIILSEIGYYFPEILWSDMIKHLMSQLISGGKVLACHWLGYSEDHVLSGDEVHEILGAAEGIRLEYSRRHEGFRIDLWVKV